MSCDTALKRIIRLMDGEERMKASQGMLFQMGDPQAEV